MISDRGGGRKPEPSPPSFSLTLILPTGVRVLTPQEKYDKENTQFVGLKLHKKNDHDILNAIEGKAKQTEIKRLIRLGLSNEVDIKPPVGMTDYQLKVFLSMFRKIAEKSSKEEIIAELDKMIENL
jgi:hypothetical protein